MSRPPRPDADPADRAAAALVGALRDAGAEFLVRDGRVAVAGRRGLFTPRLLDDLRAQRDAVTTVLAVEWYARATRLAARVAELEHAQCRACGRALPPPPERACHGCRADRLEAALRAARRAS